MTVLLAPEPNGGVSFGPVLKGQVLEETPKATPKKRATKKAAPKE